LPPSSPRLQAFFRTVLPHFSEGNPIHSIHPKFRSSSVNLFSAPPTAFALCFFAAALVNDPIFQKGGESDNEKGGIYSHDVNLKDVKSRRRKAKKKKNERKCSTK
jgi:hypothetical protein